jgi:hypothetical protein
MTFVTTASNSIASTTIDTFVTEGLVEASYYI